MLAEFDTDITQRCSNTRINEAIKSVDQFQTKNLFANDPVLVRETSVFRDSLKPVEYSLFLVFRGPSIGSLDLSHIISKGASFKAKDQVFRVWLVKC